MEYWQVAAGDRGRDYSNLFFEYGIMCVGGETQINTFKQVEEGDVVVLKRGISKILGAGKIIKQDGTVCKEDEKWLGDFEGWDLRNYANVEWHQLEKPLPISSGLTMGTIKRLHDTNLQKKANEIIEKYPKIKFKQKPDLSDIYKLENEEIIDFLIEEGFRPGNAEELNNTFNRIRMLAKFYCEKCDWDQVKEHETRTFLIIPLLFALGWSEQKLKIELGITNRRRVDIAGFSKPFFGSDDQNEFKNCKLIIESKGLSRGLDTAREQAIAYAETFPNCKKVIISNGFCYKAFQKEGDTFSTTAIAYMNLLHPTNKHPLYLNSKGTKEIFKLLLP